MPKFNPGDKVKIVLYGALTWQNKEVVPVNTTSFPVYKEDDQRRVLDMLPQIVGKEAIVRECVHGQYSVNGIPEKTAWYNEEQFQLINKAPDLSTD